LWALYCVCFLLSAWMLAHAQQQSGWTPLAPATKVIMRERGHMHGLRQFAVAPAPVESGPHDAANDLALHAAQAAQLAAKAATDAAAAAHALASSRGAVVAAPSTELVVSPPPPAAPSKVQVDAAMEMITNGHHCALCYFPPVSGKPLPYNYWGERFLFFGLGGQFNNNRQAFTVALWFARLLNRTIVIPTKEWSYISESFDMWALSHFHPVVAEENLPAGARDNGAAEWQRADAWEWVDIWYLTHADYDQDPEQDKWLHSNVMPFVGQPYRARFLLDEYGPESPKWGAQYFYYNQYWGYTRTIFSGFPTHLLDSLTHWTMQVAHFTEVMFEIAQRIIDALPKKYLSIHWRMGDYEGSAARQPWMLTAEKVIRYFIDVCGAKKEDKWTVYIGQQHAQLTNARVQQAIRRHAMICVRC
jgi:hypothetical protein